YYTDNWEGGGLGSISWAVDLTAAADYPFSEKVLNRNTLKLTYGQTRIQEEDKEWGKFRKSSDLIDYESMFVLTLNGFVDPYIGAHLVSMFRDESDSLKTRYLNPVDLTESLGAAKEIVNSGNTQWNLRLAGAVHQRINRDEAQFNDDLEYQGRESTVKNDGGVEFVSKFETSFKEGVFDFNSYLSVYEALVSSESDTDGPEIEKDAWRYPDINWENKFSINIIEYIMIRFTAQLLYDREIDRDPRIKQNVSVGFTLKKDNKQKDF
ncbi:MAG: DUF3078 domain-containing protein, partial [Chitinivibrionales bacterium]